MFTGSLCWRQERKEGNWDFLNLPFSHFQTWARIASCSWVLCLPASFLYTGCPVFLSFIFSKTEDWGYLNEDGELGLAYQGLKQVARSNTCLSSCVCFVCSACSCLRFIVFQLGWMQVHRAQFMERCRGAGEALSQAGWMRSGKLLVWVRAIAPGSGLKYMTAPPVSEVTSVSISSPAACGSEQTLPRQVILRGTVTPGKALCTCLACSKHRINMSCYFYCYDGCYAVRSGSCPPRSLFY